MEIYTDPTIAWFEIWPEIRKRLIKLAARDAWGRNNPEKQRALEKRKYERRKLRSDWHTVTARRVRNWRHAQGDEGRAKAAAAMTEWREANAKHHQAYRASYYAQNAAHLRAVVKKWREDNHEKWLIQHAALEAKRRGAEGKFSTKDFANLWIKQEGRCVYCHRDLGVSLNIDHIIAIARGGTNWPDNIQLLCESCNKRKGTKTDAEFRELMLT